MQLTPYPHLTRRGFVLPERLKMQYDSGGTGRRAKSWDAPASGPTASITPQLSLLRNRSRAAVRNDPWARAAIARWVSNSIGTGIVPYPRCPDKSLRLELKTLWEDWVPEADADGRSDFYGLQCLVARALFESGEVFVRLRPRRPTDGLSVPLQLQILESDFVPAIDTTTATGNVVRAGIEFNTWGQRVAYWMYRSHPGERGESSNSLTGLTRVPAESILHLFETLRPGQLRGVPQLATVLGRLHSLDHFDDAVLFRQEVANLFAGFIRKPAPDESPIDPATGLPIPADDDGSMLGLEPGTMQELLPGEEVQFSSPPDAGSNYGEFMRQQLLAVAAGVGVPFEILTGDLRGVNDRVIRVVLNEFRRQIEQWQWTVLIHQFCRPVRSMWLDAARLAGEIDQPASNRDRRDQSRTRWVPQGWAYIHPVQDVQSKQAMVDAGFTPRSEVILERGYDPEDIDQDIADDNARAKSLGLVFGTNTAGATAFSI